MRRVRADDHVLVPERPDCAGARRLRGPVAGGTGAAHTSPTLTPHRAGASATSPSGLLEPTARPPWSPDAPRSPLGASCLAESGQSNISRRALFSAGAPA